MVFEMTDNNPQPKTTKAQAIALGTTIGFILGIIALTIVLRIS